jgi:hypothetical protein
VTIGPVAERSLLLQATSAVLSANWTGRFTVPSRQQYPHQWGWDTAFIAVGNAWSDPTRAIRELMSQLRGQWRDGRIPHIIFNAAMPEDAYFPGPGFWRSDQTPDAPPGIRTSGVIHPPLQARAFLEVIRHLSDPEAARDLVAGVLPALIDQHDYLRTRRDVGGAGLAAIVHPWESGLDDSPAWDTPLAAVALPPDGVKPYTRRDRSHVDPAERPSDEWYDRFVQLARLYRDGGYADDDLIERVGFCVEDPLFNAIWLWATQALIELTVFAGQDPGPWRESAAEIHEGLMARLWDEKARRFLPRDLVGGRLIESNTVLSLGPLLDPGLPSDITRCLAEDLGSSRFRSAEGYGVATTALNSPALDRRRYWRGPIWLNVNWLLARGLRQHGLEVYADALDATTVRLVTRSGLREYFDPSTGAGRGTEDFSWTAALTQDIICSQQAR